MNLKKINFYFLLLTAMAGLAFYPNLVQAQTYTWNNVVIMGGGFVSGIETSPAQSGLIYSRTDVGGAYRWNNASNSWTPLTDMFPMSQGNYLGIESLAPDPSNANNVYAAAGMYLGNGNGVILSSTNQGASWTLNTIGVAMGGNATGRGMGERLAVDPNLGSVLYFGSRNNGLWKSTDSAASWAQVTAFPTTGDATYGLSFVVMDGQGGTAGTASTTLFVGVAAAAGAGSNLYESTNSGTSWAEVTGGPTGLFPRHASLGSDGNLWVAFGNDYGPYDVRGVTLSGQIWKYNVSAKTWTNVTPAANWAGMAGGISVDAQNAQHVIISTLDSYAPDKVLATTNGGTSWTVIANPDSGYGGPYSQYDANGALYLFGFNATFDGGAGVSEIGTNATNWVDAVALDPFNSNRAFYGTGEGLFVSTNIQAAGAPQSVIWTFDDSGQEETVPLYVPSSTNGAFLGEVGDDGGMRNPSVTAPAPIGMYLNPRFANTNSLDFAESNTNLVVRVGNSTATTSDVAYSTNNGQAWTPWGSAPPGYGTYNQMGSVAVAAGGSTVVVAPYNGYGNPAYATSFGGAWTSSTGLPSGAVLASDRVTSSLFYATSGTTLYVSTNGGQSFSTAGTTAGGAPRPVFGMAGEVWVAGGGALYRFTGMGTTNTKTQITSVTTCYGVGFGKAAAGQTHPAVFIIGIVGGQYGFFRCDDGMGTTWVRMNDDNHQYGWLQNNFIGGDETIFGRCYLTTGGRGYIYGDTSVTTPTPTATRTATATMTPTRTMTVTPTFTRTATASPTPTLTATLTTTKTITATPSLTPTLTASATATFSPTATLTRTASSTLTPVATFTATPTRTLTLTSTTTPTPSVTTTITQTGTPTITLTPVPGATDTFTPTVTPTPSVTLTVTATLTRTATGTPTASATSTKTGTPVPSATMTSTLTVTLTPLAAATNTATASASPTASSTWTMTRTASPTGTMTAIATSSRTPTPTLTPSFTSTSVFTNTYTPTGTPTLTPLPGVSPQLNTSSSSAAAGQGFSYTWEITVTGSASQNSTLTQTLPPGISVVGFIQGPSGAVSGSQITWSLGSLPVGVTELQVNVEIDASVTGGTALSSQGTLSYTGGSVSSNSASVSVVVLTFTPTVSPTATATPTSGPSSKVPVLYPNPVSGSGPVTIQLPVYPGMGKVTVQVFTTAFRMVNTLSFPSQAGGSQISLPLTDRNNRPLANGLYYVLVQSPAGRSILKLLILR
jgi:xyloglucan-specific exo-beta-1,4-glucanase